MPAFDLNLSSVIFASAASAATSDGGLSTKTGDTDNAFTLRYASSGGEIATINEAGSEVAITGATDNMYLVVQNSTGAYAKALTSGTTSVKASEIEGIADFYNCQVWLESTNATSRITTATEPTTKAAPSVTTTITLPAACSHEYEWIVENDPTYDTTGLRVNKCKKCGSVCASQIIPAMKDDFGASQEYFSQKIKQAKAGQTITIDFGNWNTLTKTFFEELSKKRDITMVIRFRYKNQNYEFTIDKNQTIDTSLPYYGPEKLIQLYNAHVRGK